MLDREEFGGSLTRKRNLLKEKDLRKRIERAPQQGNVSAVKMLESYLRSVDEDAYSRFALQLEALKTLAVQMDRGDVGKSHVYRQAVRDIYDRVDRIFGASNLDIIQQLDKLIDKKAAERAAKGWG